MRVVIRTAMTELFFFTPLNSQTCLEYIYNADLPLEPLLKNLTFFKLPVPHRPSLGFHTWFFVNVLASLKLESTFEHHIAQKAQQSALEYRRSVSPA